MAEAGAAVVEPVFLLNKMLPSVVENSYSVAEICSAAEEASGLNSVEGAQRIGGLWRVYAKTIDARVILLTRGVVLRGNTVQPKDKNPFIVKDNGGNERELASLKVIIGNIPMSYNNTDIARTLEKLGVMMRSNIFDEKDRVNGKLTRWKTGRRFVYVEPPSKPLPKTVQIGAFRATIYHRGQTRPMDCSRCLEKSHRTSECTNDVRCRVCHELGHVSGSHMCSLAPREQMAAPPPQRNGEESPSRLSASSPSPPSPTPPPPSTEKGERKDQATIVPTATKQTKIHFSAPSSAVARRKSRSATPTNREKRGRSSSTQRSPAQHAKKTAREETSDHEPQSRREEKADSSSGT